MTKNTGTRRVAESPVGGNVDRRSFYLTFQSSYSYTRLGRVDDPSELPQALGPRGVRVLFSKD